MNINLVYAKYSEKLFINYQTQIANPIFSIEYDNKKIIEDLENVSKSEYLFTIKNYNETEINQIELYYQFEIIGIDDNINFELKNLTTNEIIKFENNVSPKIKIGLKKEEYKYCLSINFDESNIEINKKINLKVNTYFNKEA